MFNNCDTSQNGELLFLNRIKDEINIAFDVGSRYDSEFLNINAEVHYFEPVPDFLDKLSKTENKNKKSYFNNFGLGNSNETIVYYPKYQSFCNRKKTFGVPENKLDKLHLCIKKAVDYIVEKNIKSIDFLKIDTEGYEFDVLRGFEDMITSVKIIQFEYGGTFLDNNIKMVDIISYLQEKGFHRFSYLTPKGTQLINDFTDHYNYCNIVCINKNSSIVPF